MFLTGNAPVATGFAENWSLFVGTGLPTLLIGMLVVFAILGIIFVVLQIMRATFKKNAIKAKKARKAEEAKDTPKMEAAPAEEIAPETPAAAADDGAIIAAIIAAISAHTGKAPEGFRVVSFKKRR